MIDGDARSYRTDAVLAQADTDLIEEAVKDGL
jgi:hypothetical protein